MTAKTIVTQSERDAIIADARANVQDVHGITSVIMQDAAENNQWLRCAAMAITRYAYQPDAGLPNGSLWCEIEAALTILRTNIEGSDDPDVLINAFAEGTSHNEWDYVTAAAIVLARTTRQI